MTDGRSGLKREASLLDVVMLGAGSAIGSSIFSVLGPASGVVGSGLLTAIGLAMAPMFVLAIVYAYMASAAPRTGASYAWPREFVGPDFAFFVAWLRLLGSVSMNVVQAFVLVRYLSVLLPLPAEPVMLGIFVVLYGLNVRGIAFAAKAQTGLMLLVLAAFGLFVCLGAPSANFERLTLLPEAGLLPLVVALPLLIHLFQGIETSTEIGEEVADPERTIPRGIALSIVLTLGVYLAVAAVAVGLIGPDGLAASNAPLMAAAQSVPGRLVAYVMLVAASLCLVKSLNVGFMIFSRNLFALGSSGVLPAVLGKLHPRYGTPYIASTVVLAASMLGLLMPKDLVYLFIATSVPTLLKYVSTCYSAIRLSRHRPDLHAKARFRLSRGQVLVLAGLGITAALGIAAAGLKLDWKPYLLLAGWALIGQIYLWQRRRRVAVTAAV